MSKPTLLTNLQQFFVEASLADRLKALGVSKRGMGAAVDPSTFPTYHKLFLGNRPKRPAGIIDAAYTPGYKPGGFEAQPAVPQEPDRAEFSSMADYREAVRKYMAYKERYPKLLATWQENHRQQLDVLNAADRNLHLARVSHKPQYSAGTTVEVDPDLQRQADELRAKPHPWDAGITPIRVTHMHTPKTGTGAAYTYPITHDAPPEHKSRLWSNRVPDSQEAVENILKVLKQATPEEIAYQRDWYRHAHEVAKTYARKFKKPLEMTAAVIAVLSPGLAPGPNFDAAAKILGGYWGMENAARTPGVQKAIEIVRTGDISLVSKKLGSEEASSPKITAFFNSIFDPDATQKIVVVDGHARNIWQGTPVPIKGAVVPKEWWDQIEKDYAKAGELSGYNLSAQEAQAVSWYVWRIMIEKEPMPRFGRSQVPVELPSEPESGTPVRPGAQMQQAPYTRTDPRYSPPSFMRRTWEHTDTSLLSVVDEARVVLGSK